MQETWLRLEPVTPNSHPRLCFSWSLIAWESVVVSVGKWNGFPGYGYTNQHSYEGYRQSEYYPSWGILCQQCHFNKMSSTMVNGELTFIDHVLYVRHCATCLYEVGIIIPDKTEGWTGQVTFPGSHS